MTQIELHVSNVFVCVRARLWLPSDSEDVRQGTFVCVPLCLSESGAHVQGEVMRVCVCARVCVCVCGRTCMCRSVC